MTSSDFLMQRLAAVDPARGVVPDAEAAELLLERVITSPSEAGRGEGRTGGNGAAPLLRHRPRLLLRGPALAVVLLLTLILAAAALAATGVIQIGAPTKPSSATQNPQYGIGALAPGSERVLSLQTPDPSGGLPWGLRVISTTRGVGCIEVGRKLADRIGVLGQDGAFSNDGSFHELPPAGLSAGGACANLDRNQRLFQTAAMLRIPASGSPFDGSCAPLTRGEEIAHLSPRQICPESAVRRLYYGLLGPDATGLTYTFGGETHILTPIGPEGAYLIVLPVAAHKSTAERLWESMAGSGVITSRLPQPWSSPITSVSYRDGSVCHIAALGPGVLKEHCNPVGYQPAKAPSQGEVQSPIHARLATVHGRRMIRVSFTARLTVNDANSAYELTEYTSSPLAEYLQTKQNIAAGQTVSWLLPADLPGTYSGKVTYGVNLPASYPTYGPGHETLVGHFRVRVTESLARACARIRREFRRHEETSTTTLRFHRVYVGPCLVSG